MTTPNDLSGESILKYIKDLSRKKRAAPLDCFIQFLHDIWMDNTPEEALEQWRVKVTHFPWYADDALFCLKWIIENPPVNLPELLEQHGWISLYHEAPETGEIVYYTFSETLDWLRALLEQYQAIFDQG